MDEELLHKWLQGEELTESELAQLQTSDEWLKWQRLFDKVDTIEEPEFDAQASLQRLKQRRDFQAKQSVEQSQEAKIEEKKQAKVIQLPFRQYIAAAASVAILVFGFYTWQNSGIKQYQTGSNQTASVQLPDGSKVILNENSSIKFNKRNFSKNRVVQHKGEAFYDVESGSQFQVKSPNGLVTVLGTEFTVKDRDAYRVECFEGKVGVALANESYTELTVNKGLLWKKDDSERERYDMQFHEAPYWLNKDVRFTKAPLSEIIEFLETTYDITVDASAIDQNRTFTGTVPHDNLALALETIGKTMNVNTIQKSNSIVILQDK